METQEKYPKTNKLFRVMCELLADSRLFNKSLPFTAETARLAANEHEGNAKAVLEFYAEELEKPQSERKYNFRDLVDELENFVCELR